MRGDIRTEIERFDARVEESSGVRRVRLHRHPRGSDRDSAMQAVLTVWSHGFHGRTTGATPTEHFGEFVTDR